MRRSARRLLTVHASGGPAHAHARGRPRCEGRRALQIVAVTVLTSLDDADLRAIGVARRRPTHARRARAPWRSTAGVRAFVCSPKEVRAPARRARARRPMLITPGVRPAGADAGDQKRVDDARGRDRVGARARSSWDGPIRDAAIPLRRRAGRSIRELRTTLRRSDHDRRGFICGLQPVREAIAAHGDDARACSSRARRLAAARRRRALRRAIAAPRSSASRRAELDRWRAAFGTKVPSRYAPPLRVLALAELELAESPLVVVLDSIEDPQNFGAVVRSAVAIGRDGDRLARARRRSALARDVPRERRARSSTRSSAASPSLPSALETLRARGLRIVGLDAGGDTPLASEDLDAADRARPRRRGRGPAQERAKARATSLARLPMSGPVALAERLGRGGDRALRSAPAAARASSSGYLRASSARTWPRTASRRAATNSALHGAWPVKRSIDAAERERQAGASP